MLRDPVVWLPAGLVGLIRWNDFQSSMFNFHAVERQWYREQACNKTSDMNGTSEISLADLRAAHEVFFPNLMGADAALA